MPRFATASLLLGLGLFVCGATGNAQTEQFSSSRKVVNRVVPSYPPLARPLNLSGTVKLEVLVSPDGRVKTVQDKGGNPVFVRAAESALREWKWEKSGQWTTELVEFDFKP